ncbi:MAG: tetratricopeptide repeat protein [Anaerolineae bacterium]|nr:tetratricopeptide repeat protein [Anaerolineae bacterium]
MDPNDLFLSMALRQHCGQGSPWIVCEKCIARYPDVNRDQAREYATKWWRDRHWTPPGNGPVNVSVAIPFLSDKAADIPHLIASAVAQQVLEARESKPSPESAADDEAADIRHRIASQVAQQALEARESKPSAESAADELKKKCITCQTDVDVNVTQCPHCGGTLFRMTGPPGALAQEVERKRKRNEAIRHNNRCGEYFQKGQFAEAEQELRKALEVDPSYALTYSNMGLVMHEQGRLEEAITWLEKALALDPKLAGVVEGLVAYKAERQVLEAKPAKDLFETIGISPRAIFYIIIFAIVGVGLVTAVMLYISLYTDQGATPSPIVITATPVLFPAVQPTVYPTRIPPWTQTPVKDTATSIFLPTRELMALPSVTPSITPEPSITPVPTNPSPQTPTVLCSVYTDRDLVPIRTQPSREGVMITMVDQGTAMDVLDQDLDSQNYLWYQVTFWKEEIEITGWVRSDMVQPLENSVCPALGE